MSEAKLAEDASFGVAKPKRAVGEQGVRKKGSRVWKDQGDSFIEGEPCLCVTDH